MRKGTSEGYTEIHLSSGQSRPTIIKRVLSSSSNSTEWFLNGGCWPLLHVVAMTAWHLIQVCTCSPWYRVQRQVTHCARTTAGQKATQAAVLEKVSDLKIQVDNLCQVGLHNEHLGLQVHGNTDRLGKLTVQAHAL